MKKTTKEIYSQPTFKLLVIRFEKNLMSVGINNQGGSFDDPNADIDDYSDEDWW